MLNLSEALKLISDAAETVQGLNARADLAMADLATAIAERDRARKGERDGHALAVLVSRLVAGEIRADDPALRLALSRVQRAMLGASLETVDVEPVQPADVVQARPMAGGVPVMARPVPAGPRPGGAAATIPMPAIVGR